MILGIHSNKKTSIEGDTDAKTTEHAIARDIKKYGINAIQIFTHNPRTGVKIAMDYSDVAKITSDIKLLVHGPYNLLRVFMIPEEELKEQLKILEIQFKAAAAIGASGIVFHISKSTAVNTAMAIKMILPLAEQYGIQMIIESVACNTAANKTYESTKLINEVNKILKSHPLDRFWSWCIDTAHMWSMGVEVANKHSFAQWLASIERPEKVSTFHLNGSSTGFKSGKDKHEIPFTSVDNIWYNINPTESGVAALVEFATKYNCVTILEINRGETQGLEKCIKTVFDLEKKINERTSTDEQKTTNDNQDDLEDNDNDNDNDNDKSNEDNQKKSVSDECCKDIDLNEE